MKTNNLEVLKGNDITNDLVNLVLTYGSTYKIDSHVFVKINPEKIDQLINEGNLERQLLDRAKSFFFVEEVTTSNKSPKY